MEKKLRWLRLDNAAKIYPAARNQRWSNVFRLSATLCDTIDVAVMQCALDVTVRRFPSIAARLRKGVFWYYLQQLHRAPQIRMEASYPLTRMGFAETRQCALRVIVYRNRVAVEYFHSLTDGTGGTVFLKNLVAEYLRQKYGAAIAPQGDILDCRDDPKEEELEDSFLRYAGPVSASRKENPAWRLTGTPEQNEFLHLICLQLSAAQVKEKAKSYGVSITAFLVAAMMDALQRLQQAKIPNPMHRKRIRVQVPINLRRHFPSKTMRNFSYFTTPELDPRLGAYTFPEICALVQHHLGLEVTPKNLSTRIAANVGSEKLLIVRVLPLFLKNMVMKAVYKVVGEKYSCLSVSNLGVVTMPEEMASYVRRLDFILGPQSQAPHNCGIVTWGDDLYINLIRNIREPELEACFCQVLKELELDITVQSNDPKGV